MAYNVLIVDDSDVMRSVIKRVLSLTGVELGDVHEAGNGKEALDLLQDNWVDFVLTDVNMPVMDGVTFLTEMKTEETFANIPVIIVSTEGRTDKINDIISKGAAGYITKPFKPEDIRTILHNSLGVEFDGSNVEEPEDSDF